MLFWGFIQDPHTKKNSNNKLELSQSAAYPHTVLCNRTVVILWKKKKTSWKCLNCEKNHYIYKGH